MKKRVMILLLLPLTVRADESVLLQRIVALEKRVAELEERLAPVLEQERIKKVAEQQRGLARERMLLDAEFMSRHDLTLAEKAYQMVSRDPNSEEAEKAFKLLVENYPRANRTGCAVLARAQAISGSEQLDLLQAAIEQYSSCYYQNGVNVGAYARLYLGMRDLKDGRKSEAEKLFDEVRTLFPDAIDHKGQLLTAHIDGLLPPKK